MFIDTARIYVKAGNGGNGCCSFYKPKGSRYKHPDGGDGGKGGDIYIICDTNLSTLLDFRYKREFRASSGKHGSSNNKKGKDGVDIYIKVPPGTIVKNASSNDLISDICRDRETVLVAKGGRGGRGNASKREAELGVKGQSKELDLELKLIADIGLVGLPNAGKSTFISYVTKANPKIASYPFTTKTPVLGSIKIEDQYFVIADIPGLIEGAHKGKGLGDKFLRHIERTKILVFLIDVSPVGACPPSKSYKQLIKELQLFSKELICKPRIIALNKIDQLGEKFNISKFSDIVKEDSIYLISSVTGRGIPELLVGMKDLVQDEKRDRC